MIYLGTPRPSIEWWIQDDQGEKLLLHTDAQKVNNNNNNEVGSSSESFLDYGPLQRKHHDNEVTCEARNNNKIPPLAKSLRIQMICKPHYKHGGVQGYRISRYDFKRTWH